MLLRFNKVLFPSKIRKLKTGQLIGYNTIDPIQIFGESSEEQGYQLAQYRWWWRLLRLCLELEKRRIKLLGDEVRVDRRFYKSWDVETILTTQFATWWKSHQHLFLEEPVSMLTRGELGRLEQGFSRAVDSEYIYLKVPKYLESAIAFEQIKKKLNKKVRRSSSLFRPSGRPTPLIRHHIQFNCLVMSINGSNRGKIMNWCNYQYQGVRGAIQKKQDNSGLKIDKVFSYEQSVSRHLARARKNLILIGKGEFS